MSPPALHLRLFVAGESRNSQAARTNLDAILATAEVAVRLEVVDVLEDPSRAMADGILLTPTLLKLHPLPTEMIIGDLHQRPVVERALGLVVVER